MKKYNHLINLSLILGITISTLFLSGGYDAYYFYLRNYHSTYTTPIWVYFTLSPLKEFIWPVGWMLLVWFTLITIFYVCQITKVNFIHIIWSIPVIYNLWLGQIEVIDVLVVLGIYLITEKKLSAELSAIIFIFGLSKVQVTLLPLIYLAIWLYKSIGWKFLVANILASLVGISVFTLFKTEWLINWIITLRGLSFGGSGQTYYNIVYLGFGLLSFWPMKYNKNRLALLLVLTNLIFPYYYMYRSMAIMVLSGNIIFSSISWVFFLAGLQYHYFYLIFLAGWIIVYDKFSNTSGIGNYEFSKHRK